MAVDDQPVASPCVRLCTLNDDDICGGCFRSLEEIKSWSRLDGPERRAVLTRADRRRDAAPPVRGWMRVTPRA